VGIINIRITKFGKGSANAQCDIITEVFTEEGCSGGFRTVEAGTGVKVAKIMARANANAKLTFLAHRLLLCQGKYRQTKKEDQVYASHNAAKYGLDLCETQKKKFWYDRLKLWCEKWE
jgi:hypothetical protein